MSRHCIVISSPAVFAGEAALINRLFEQGLELFYLRKPGLLVNKLHQLVQQVRPAFRERLILPYEYWKHWNCMPCGQWIHFTETERMKMDKNIFRLLTSMNNRLSTSTHNSDAYLSLDSCFAFSFFGPVFDSISKKDHAALSRNEWEVLNYKSRTGIIALGGITMSNMNELLCAGFDGIALLGSIWQTADPVASFKQFYDALRETHHL